MLSRDRKYLHPLLALLLLEALGQPRLLHARMRNTTRAPLPVIQPCPVLCIRHRCYEKNRIPHLYAGSEFWSIEENRAAVTKDPFLIRIASQCYIIAARASHTSTPVRQRGPIAPRFASSIPRSQAPAWERIKPCRLRLPCVWPQASRIRYVGGFESHSSITVWNASPYASSESAGVRGSTSDCSAQESSSGRAR